MAAGTGAGICPAFQNPVLDWNFPDPGVLFHDGRYYAFATNHTGSNVQTAVSNDLVTWKQQPDALPALPSWAIGGNTWAPEAVPGPNGDFLLYFSAASRQHGCQCIGVARSRSPSGPYENVSDEPLVAAIEQGGAIDPSAFVAFDGRRYLIWKNDGNAIGQPTHIWLQPLSQDGIRTVAAPNRLISNDQSWEGAVVEAPFIWSRNGKYYLFYSANSYEDGRYALGYAVSDSLEGPYTKARGPWQRTADPASNGGHVLGPGACVVTVGPDGRDWLVYHSADPAEPRLSRKLCVAPIDWTPRGPRVSLTWRVPAPAGAEGGDDSADRQPWHKTLLTKLRRTR